MRSSLRPAPSRAAAAPARAFRAPELMGVVNATPDSFFPDSRAKTLDAVVEKALLLAEQGARVIDLGGQSTRPGSDEVPLELELERVIPALTRLAKVLPPHVYLSVDTDKAEVARRALDAGAKFLNDVSALRRDPGMAKVAVKYEKVVLMHRLGDSSKTMQAAPRYSDAPAEVAAFLRERGAAFFEAGGKFDQLMVDPGIGFGKELDHNLSLIKRVSSLAAVAPVVLGVSRKSMFGKLHPDSGPQDRLAGSLAVAAWACYACVSILRVHDVLETRKLIETLKAVEEAA
ncbi:MAG: dihydropteroate synthase [Elusimicrobiota bacterium]|nr:dihydropteroate synthase [Elusimicrobiota bacterium]